MAGSSNDTYAGALEVLMKQLATMKGLADANLPFIVQLETQVIGEIRSPERMMQQAGIIPPGQQNPQGMGALGLPPGGGMPPQGMPGGASAPAPSQLGAGVPGVQQSPAPVNPDEMRRILTT